MNISEIIVVEGRDDTAAVKRAVNAITIETHGFGMDEKMWIELEKAYNTKGIIIFTDPDYAGEKIRRTIKTRFPNAKEAFLPRKDGRKGNNIGIENASPEAIQNALSKVVITKIKYIENFSIEDLRDTNLINSKNAKALREATGNILGIGYGNAKSFLTKLNGFGISRYDFNNAVIEGKKKIADKK